MPRRILLNVVVVSVLLVGCGGGGATAAPGDSATRLAQTAEAILTATVKARETPALATPAPATQSPQTQPTTAPVASAPPAACANDSMFVSDVTIPDGTHLAPNAAFIKVWRIRNTGTCPWTTAYEYRFIGGDQLGGASIRLPNGVQPNDTIDISISFTAPATAGSYRSQWRLYAPDGTPFGQKPYVLISVP